jgi:precorrin-2 dehydrogenase/sirohydrochlorin ferrochelatase
MAHVSDCCILNKALLPEMRLLPIVLDGSRLRVGLCGRGEGLKRRLDMLAKACVQPAAIETTVSAEGLSGISLLLIAGLDSTEAANLARLARAAGVLVNVEDMPALCDFHIPAQLRRGDLLLTVSTGGRSPGLARILRERLEGVFGPEWEDTLDRLASARQQWRAEGLRPKEISQRTRAMLERED